MVFKWKYHLIYISKPLIISVCSASDNSLQCCCCTCVRNCKTSSNCPKFSFITVKFCFEYERSSLMLNFLINILWSWLLLSSRTDLWYCSLFSVYFLAFLLSPSASSSGLFSISWYLSDLPTYIDFYWWNNPHIYPILHWLTSFWSNLLIYPLYTTWCNCLTKRMQLSILEQWILLYWL